MSEASPRPDDDWAPKCRRHGDEPVPMADAVLRIHFPRGSLPVRGHRCPVCHEEWLPMDEAAEAERTAHELGLYGAEGEQTRKLLKTGNSIAVTLDPELLRQVMPDAEPGARVRVGRQGDAIVIRPAEAEAAE